VKKVIARNLKKYRKGLGITQEQLAEEIGISRGSINNYENGKSLPTGKVLSLMANALEVSADALLREDEKFRKFRFRANVSFYQSPQFKTKVSELIDEYSKLEECCGLNKYAPETIPCIRKKGNEKLIQDVANQFRSRLGAGQEPFNNFFREVEKIGLKCLRLPIDIKGFFGLSAWSENDGAFIMVNTKNITIERQLYTLAHEIGHLIFHRFEYDDNIRVNDDKNNREQEEVANYFANHLLISAKAFEELLHSVHSIVELKKHFRVSYLVILKRLEEMSLISYDDFLRKICLNYRRQSGKPLKRSMELPPALNGCDFPENERYKSLIFKALEKEEITENKASELLGISLNKVREARIQGEEIFVA